MPSFDTVNYSLRPSKSIQRQIIFEGLRRIQFSLRLENSIYIGFGSIWFTDFIAAHKILKIDDMISIEANEIGYERAKFNSPYATVRVLNGRSTTVLPDIINDEEICRRPWLVWLDYDYEYDETLSDDIRLLIERAPVDSVLLVTFNGAETKYGRVPERAERLQKLFGAVVPDDLPKRTYRDDKMQETLADFALASMQSIAADLSRPGGFVPAFRVIYKDSSPMVTVGGVLPAPEKGKTASDVITAPGWPCKPSKRIIAPHLTMREAAVLQSKLPSPANLSREAVRALGFDLEESQIETFQKYYNQYPMFGQIVA